MITSAMHGPRAAVVLAALLAVAGCSDTPELQQQVGAFRVTFAPGTDVGSDATPLPFEPSEAKALKLVINVEALRNDAPSEVDTSYSGYAVVRIQPAGETVVSLGAGTTVVKLVDGRAQAVPIEVYKAHGKVRLTVTDLGYVPNISGAACGNGVDDDGDGFVDEDDRGCLGLSDDTETGGTGATGASEELTFVYPRIYDVQRPLSLDSSRELGSPLWKNRVSIRRGWLLVTRVATEGMYVTDFASHGGDKPAVWDSARAEWTVDPLSLQFDHMYVFSFSTPVNLQVGDCLVSLDGAVDEFYGYTEMTKPTWKKGDYAFCAAKAKAAGLAECPTDNASASTDAGKTCRQRIEKLADTPLDITKLMIPKSGSSTGESVFSKAGYVEAFEAGFVKLTGVQMFTRAWLCDLDGDGYVSSANPDEKSCRDQCGAGVPAGSAVGLSCTERNGYQQYGQWSFTVVDGAGETQELLAVTSAAIPNFDPMAKCVADASNVRRCTRPATSLTSIAGTVRDFEFGKPRWIVEARTSIDCSDCKP